MTEIVSGQSLKLLNLNWKICRNSPCGMARGAAVGHGGLAYFTSFDSDEIFSYDSEKDDWHELPRCPQYDFGLAVVGNLLTAVGNLKGGLSSNYLSSFINGEWKTVFPPMPTNRSRAAVVSAQNYLIAAGGLRARGGGKLSAAQSRVDVMDVNTRKWYIAASLPEPVYDMSATVCGGRLYLLGGRDKNLETTHAVFTCTLDSLIRSCCLPPQTPPYVSEARVWQRVTDVPVVRSTCTTLNGRLLAIGGESLSIPVATVHIYNPDSDSWLLLANMPTARSWCLVVGLRDCIITAGGFTLTSIHATNVEVGYLRFSGKPTMPELLNFSIATEVGTKYEQFSTVLLQDSTGSRVKNMAHKYFNDPERINTDILKEWLAGSGKLPVTWATLVNVLHDIGLSTLADSISTVQCQPSHMQ